MRRFLLAMALLGSSLGSGITLAAEKTVKLSVPGMTCASCPYIVKRAISALDGIKQVVASWEDKTATVTFNDEVTSVDAIRAATAKIGYPATPIKAEGS